MKRFTPLILIFLTLVACKNQAEIEVSDISTLQYYGKQYTHIVSNESDKLNYTISLPNKFNFAKEKTHHSCVITKRSTYLIPTRSAQLVKSISDDWTLEPYQVHALADSTFTFDFYKLDQNLYPRFSHGTGKSFNHRDIIPRQGTPILGHGIIRLKNNYQIHYVLYAHYSSTILDAYIINPEHLCKLTYEQFNYTNYAQIDSALAAFQTFR